MLNLTGVKAAVENWQTDFYTGNCASVFQSYMRDLDISLDGKYFVITTTGAHNGSTSPCDTSSRWETAARGSALKATWINTTGGDTQYAVAITSTVVYIGGHRAGRTTRSPPTSPARARCPRPGHRGARPGQRAAADLEPDPRARCRRVRPAGDLDRALDGHRHRAHRPELRVSTARIAFFPLAGGTVIEPNNTPSLPSDIYRAGSARRREPPPRACLPGERRWRTPSSADGGPDWAVRHRRLA